MTHGYLFKLAPGFWGILAYLDRPTVFIRVIDTDSVYQACEELSRTHAGHFSPADTDQVAWGNVIFKARGGAELLTG